MDSSQLQFWDTNSTPSWKNQNDLSYVFPGLFVEPDPMEPVRYAASKKKVLYLPGISTSNFKADMINWRGGFQVETPKLWDYVYYLDKNLAQKAFDDFEPDVVIGSSRGGALALDIETKDVPLVLLAPAWKYFGSTQNYTNKKTYILHSEQDNLIPYEHSKELMENSNGKVKLWKCGNSHTLSDFQTSKFLVELLWSICKIPVPKIEDKPKQTKTKTVPMPPVNNLVPMALGELFGPIRCESGNCSNMSWVVWMTPKQYNFAKSQKNPIYHVFQNRIGVALCDHHAQKLKLKKPNKPIKA